jgi:hypothetical protein
MHFRTLSPIAALLVLLVWSCASLDPAGSGVDQGSARAGGASLAAQRAAIDVSRYRTATPEARASNVPEDLNARAFAKPGKGLQPLVDWLLEGQSDPYLKAKMLHDWEALSISYDVKAYFANSIPDQGAYSVLARKCAVCAGYAALYKLLCDLGGIECAVVSGQARGLNFSSGKGLMGHDWNAVRIDGVWRPVDVTWDSGYVNSEKDYGHHYGTSYFLLDPEFMIYTHFPASARQQFLDRPVPLDAFEDLPFADGDFLTTTGLPLDALHISNESTGLSTVEIPRKNGVRLGASLAKANSASWNGSGGVPDLTIPIIEGDGKSSLVLAFPSAGDYVLTVYAWKSKELGSTGGCQFLFKAKSGSKHRPVGFSPEFQEVAGLPREGGTLDAHVKKELSLTFSCAPELRLQAHLGTAKGNVVTYLDGGAVVSRVAGGYKVNVAFPAKGEFSLSLSAEAPGKELAWTSLPLIADEAADHGYLDFPREFLNLTGAPSGGVVVSDRALSEFSLSFPAAEGVELEAALSAPRTVNSAETGISFDSASRRRCLVKKGPGGLTLKVAFPKPGTYSLWLQAAGPNGETASANLSLKADSGLGHGYVSFDKRLVELAGMPELRSPEGARLGELASDVVGKRIDLFFPKSDGALNVNLYIPHGSGDTTNFESVSGAGATETGAGCLVTVVFPKPGEYAVFISGLMKGEAKRQVFDGIYLTSR